MKARLASKSFCIAVFALQVAACIGSAQVVSLAAVRKLIQEGSYPRAEQALKSLLTSQPGNVDAHIMLGDVFAVEGQRALAIDELSRAIALKPDSAMAYSILGLALSRFYEMDAARQAFERAIALDPNLVEAHVNYALLLARTDDLNGAGGQLDIAIRLEGDTPAAASSHLLRAKIYEQQEDLPEAERELARAVKLQPQYEDGWFSLGKLKQQELDHSGALAAFQQAGRMSPENPVYQYEIGSEELALSNVQAAIPALQKAAAKMGNDPAVLYKLLRALRQHGSSADTKKVEAQLRTVVAKSDQAALRSLDAQHLDSEGVALEQQGQVLRAAAKYRAALELYPEQSGYRLNYALALCRLDRWNECIEEIREVLREDASNADARKALYIAEDRAEASNRAQRRAVQR